MAASAGTGAACAACAPFAEVDDITGTSSTEVGGDDRGDWTLRCCRSVHHGKSGVKDKTRVRQPEDANLEMAL